jgi:transcriptional regulator with XRE-family HTH domain
MTNEEATASISACPTRPRYADRHVGRKVRERRVALGMTREELARLAGITSEQLHECEQGLGHVSAGRLYWIAEALGTEVGFFFEGVGGRQTAGGGSGSRDSLRPPLASAAIRSGMWGDTAPGSPVGEFLAAIDRTAPLPAGSVGRGRSLAILLLAAFLVVLSVTDLQLERDSLLVTPSPSLAPIAGVEPPSLLVAREPEAHSPSVPVPTAHPQRGVRLSADDFP